MILDNGDKWENGAVIRPGFSRTHETIQTGLQLRATLRAGEYAWPGGYQMALSTSDGETLCYSCGRAEFPQIARAIRDRSRCGWRVVGSFIHWEGEPLQCAHCNRSIPSAYGSDE